MKHNNEFVMGYGVALAALVRLHGQESMAVDIAACDGLGFEDFETCGLGEFDLKPLRRAYALEGRLHELTTPEP